MNDTTTKERPPKGTEVNDRHGELVELPAGYEANQSLAVSLARAEVDQQIATARALPRSLSHLMANILTLATLDDETAEECVYALPRAGKAIKGPSIRLAEIIAGQWGNCRVGARVVHVDKFEKYVEAEGIFHDLETNTATTSRVRRRISDKRGRVFNDDMIVVTGNAAASIAKRNAILGGVPKAVWRRAYTEVEKVIAGDVKTLTERRDRAMKAFAAFGVTPEQVFAVLEVDGLDDIGLDHLLSLTGMHSALKSGESTVEEMFAPPQPTNGDRPASLKDALDQLANGNGEDAGKPGNETTGATDDTASGESAGNGAGQGSSESPAAGGSPEQQQPGAEAAGDGKTAAAAPAKAKGGKADKDKGSPAASTPAAGEAKADAAGAGQEQPKDAPAARLSDEEKTKLRGYNKLLGGAERQNKLQSLSSEYWQEDGGSLPDEGTPVGDAVEAIFAWHMDRVAKKLSPADVDNKVRELLK